MNSGFLKELLRIKLKIADAGVEMLPSAIRSHAVGFHQSILATVNEVALEYLESKKADNGAVKPKNISID